MIFVPKTMVTFEHVCNEVDGRDVIYGVTQRCQTWSIPYITLIKQWTTISIPTSSSLYHYNNDKDRGEEALGSNIQGNS